VRGLVAGVFAVGECDLDPGALSAHGLQRVRQRIAVMDIRRGNLALDRQLPRFDRDMALAALNLFASIVGSRSVRPFPWP